jgi:hypothetical protein
MDVTKMESEYNVMILGNQQTPGPATYSPPSTFGGGPKCSMRPRISLAIPPSCGSYVTLKTTIGTGVKHSLSSRPPPPKVFVSPAPGYVPPAFGSKARACGFSHATPQKVKVTPGPGHYHISPRALNAFGENGPRTAFRGGRRSFATVAEPVSPGPAVYNPRLHSNNGAPRWTIKGRQKSPRKN